MLVRKTVEALKYQVYSFLMPYNWGTSGTSPTTTTKII